MVSESNHVVLINKDGQEISAWSVVRDELNDIALLEVSDSNYLPPALPLSDTKIWPGARVFTIGFPGPNIIGKLPTVSDGIISGNTGLDNNPGRYQTTVPIPEAGQQWRTPVKHEWRSCGHGHIHGRHQR